MTRRLPFQLLLHPGVGEGATPFPGLLHFNPVLYLIMLSIKHGGIKYNYLSLWYDSTWDWNLVPWTMANSLLIRPTHTHTHTHTHIYIYGYFYTYSYGYIYVYIIHGYIYIYIYIYSYGYTYIFYLWVYIYEGICFDISIKKLVIDQTNF